MKFLGIVLLFAALVAGVAAILLPPPGSILMAAVAGLAIWAWSRIK